MARSKIKKLLERPMHRPMEMRVVCCAYCLIRRISDDSDYFAYKQHLLACVYFGENVHMLSSVLERCLRDKKKNYMCRGGLQHYMACKVNYRLHKWMRADSPMSSDIAPYINGQFSQM